MKHRIPPPEILPEPTQVPTGKCGTCAYRVPGKTEDFEMLIGYYMEAQQAHPCHERPGFFCKGSCEQTEELERLVQERIEEAELIPC